MAQQLAGPRRSLDLDVKGLGRCLRLRDCPDLLETLGSAMPGWPYRAQPASGPAPAIRLRPEGQGYFQRSPALPRGLHMPTAVSGVCSLLADLVGAFFDRHPEFIGLHCGSVEVDGRLLIFPDAHRAGKSTLTAAFAAAGQRLFGDDVLALTPDGQGMAMGIAPRLRLPLPVSLDPAMRIFLDRHAGPADDRYGYLALPQDRLARHGECLPLGALVLLEREDTLETPEIIPLAPGEGLLQLLCQNFSHDAPSEALVERFLPLMARLPCLLMRYAEPLAATRRLIETLSDAKAHSASPAFSLTGHRQASGPGHGKGGEMGEYHEAVHGPGGCDGVTWRTRPVVRDYPLADELFLIHGPTGAIHRLNATGRAAWTLLSLQPMTIEALVDLLGEHYAGVTPDRLAADLADLIERLADASLIEPVPVPGD